MLKRTPLKKTKSTLKKSPIKKKPKSLEQKQAQKEQRNKDIAFYQEVWNERHPYCEVTGVYLGKEPKIYMFDHLLEKSVYPQFRYEKKNIILLSFQAHELKTNGYPLPKHQAAIGRAKLLLLSGYEDT